MNNFLSTILSLLLYPYETTDRHCGRIFAGKFIQYYDHDKMYRNVVRKF